MGNKTAPKKIETLLIGGSILAAEELNKLLESKIIGDIFVYAPILSDDIRLLMDKDSQITYLKTITPELTMKVSLIIITNEYPEIKDWLEVAKNRNIPIEETFNLIKVDKRKRGTGAKTWKQLALFSFIAFILLLSLNILSFYFDWNDVKIAFDFLNKNTDDRFIALLCVGFVAQMIDGALGMGYGVTSTAALLYLGIPLPSISSSIHTAEIFSSGASGFSHYKFGNVNKKLLKNIVYPGVAGAIIGAILLSTLGEEYAKIIKPMLAVYTLLLGIKIFSNAFKKRTERKKIKRVGWLAGVGGFLDSFGGGGWGPVVTSNLISKGKTPKYVIGTVSLTEFFVTMASALTFFTVIGIGHWQLILALVLGGILAAPLAARLAGKLPLKQMFLGVGILIILWSLNILLKSSNLY